MRIFLSYLTRDIEPAERLAEGLRRQRPDLEVFLDRRVLAVGAYWIPRLADELAKADAVLFLVGQRIGPWQELEYYEAQRLSRKAGRDGRPVIVPVIMEKQAPGLPFFELLHHIFASDPAHPDALAAVLAGLAGATPAGAEPAWKRFNPYKGLPALTSADAAFFFGREELTAAILDALRPNPDTVLVLIGASGVGKSSVAQAGVLAALKSQLWPLGQGTWPAELADSRGWLQMTIRPGEAPLKELALGFVRLIVDRSYEQDSDAEGWVERFRRGAKLADLLRIVRRELEGRTGSDALRRFLLYVDQGEELYSRAPPGDAQRFSALLAEAARLPDVHVLASLRADYYGQLQADAALFPATQRIDIPPLQADGLETVIRRPAERLGARFDLDEMPSQIAAATASEPGALPLLSYLMSDMWAAMQARGDGVLRWSERPEVIDIAAPLRERAERFRALNPGQEGALRRLFTLRLAHVPPEGETVRRRARKGECAADEWAIAETLAEPDWRLLTLNVPDGGQEPTAEVAHEQLLRKWPTLTRWLEGQRGFLVWKGEIEADRREWDKLPEAERATGLLSGRRLQRAQQWIVSHRDEVPAADRAFVEASIAADKDRRDKAELDQKRLQELALEAALQREAAAKASEAAAKEREAAATASEAAAKKIARRTVLGTMGAAAMGGVAGVTIYRADKQQRDLNEQLASDLRSFWTQKGDDAALRTVPGGAEETRPAEGGTESGDGQTGVPSWAIKAVGADRSPYTGKGCVVALLGTGVEASHPAFRGVTLIQKDFTGTGNGDRHGHDTHTGGTIFGRPVGNQRFGVAPGVTEVLVAKVLDERGAGRKEAIWAGLQWVINHPRKVDVICVAMGQDYVREMSFRLQEPVAAAARAAAAANKDIADGISEVLHAEVAKGLRDYWDLLRTYQSFSAVAASVGKGAVLVMPAGNDSTAKARAPVTSPMSLPQGVISVGAVKQEPNGYTVPWFSNSLPTLTAPGSELPSAFVKGEIRWLSGTSMSCACAAGVAALWWEYLRSKKPAAEVTSRMVASEMLKAARSDVFAPEVQAFERGAGLIQAPPAT
jgi:subtilisin family serine protease